MNRFAILAVVLALYGCATPVIHDTASGRTETIFRKDLTATHAALLNGLVNRGYQITKDSPNLIVAERPLKGGAAFLLGSQMNPIPVGRMSFTIIPSSAADTRVVVDMAAVTNPGTGFEQLTPANGSADSTAIQAWLSGLAAS